METVGKLHLIFGENSGKDFKCLFHLAKKAERNKEKRKKRNAEKKRNIRQNVDMSHWMPNSKNLNS